MSRVGRAARCESVVALVNCRCLVKRQAIRVGVRPRRPGSITASGSGLPLQMDGSPRTTRCSGTRDEIQRHGWSLRREPLIATVRPLESHAY